MDILTAAKEVMTKISTHGECFMVGGAVRDFILGVPCNDIDLVTNVKMELIESLFETVDIGRNKDFGLVVVLHEGHTFEVAHYRTDVYTGSTTGVGADTARLTESLEEDVSRRDFTINGLAMDVNGNILDYVGGQEDIKKQEIKAIGNPETRFKEDYIRMLRAIRFVAKLKFSFDIPTLTSIMNLAPKIVNITPERISQELIKAASTNGYRFATYMLLLKSTGLLKILLPEIDCYDQFEHSPEHHPEGNVWKHTIASLEEYKGRDPMVNLAILFHDIGKPVTFSIGEDKLIHYLNHSKDGLPIIDKIAERLKFSNELRDCLKFSCEHHMRMHFITYKDNRSKLVDLMHSPYFQTLMLVSECDTKSRLDAFDPKEWNRVKDTVLEMVRIYGHDPLTTIRSVVTGELVMETCNFTKPGKAVGQILAMVVRRIAKNMIPIAIPPDVMTVHDMCTIIKYIKESRTVITGIK